MITMDTEKFSHCSTTINEQCPEKFNEADHEGCVEEISSTLRVAFVHDWMFTRRGGERVLEKLLDLFPDAPVYALFGAEPSHGLLKTKNQHRIIYSFLAKIPKIEKIYKLFLPLFPAAIESFNLQEYDIVISSSHCVAKGIITDPNALHLCYLHSPMRYAWDQEHTYFKNSPSVLRPLEIVRRIILSCLRVWDTSSSIRVNKFICNSKFVALRCQQYYGRKGTVLYPCVDISRFERLQPKISAEKERTVLIFSAWTPNKKLDAALSILIANGIAVTAAGTGKVLEELASKHKNDPIPCVTFVTNPTDTQVEELYANAHCFLFPALEDFGIVAIEAMAAGLMVVAPNCGGTAETVVPGKTGFHFQNEDWQDMVKKVQLALSTPKSDERMADLRSYAKSFGVENFQKQFMRELKTALKEKREATGSL